MRILFVINTNQYGGAEKHLLALVKHLAVSGLNCVILCYGSDFYSERLRALSHVRVIQREGVDRVSLLSYWTTMFQIRPNIVVFVKGWMFSFPLQAYLAATFCGAGRLFTLEQLIAPPAPSDVQGHGVWNWLRRMCGWRARHMSRIRAEAWLCHRTVCISNAVRERLVGEYGFRNMKTVVIRNGVDLREYGFRKGSLVREKLEIDPDEPVLVCLCRLVSIKRVDVLLDAMSIISKTSRCRCIIVGDGLMRDTWVAQSKSLGLCSVVAFVGFQEDVKPYFEAADILVAPSEWEGQGMTLTEAMAFGLPCVVTNIEGHNEVVIDGQTGLLVAVGSAQDLARAIEYLLAHPEERKRMGLNGRKRAEEVFSLEESLKKYETVLLG